MNRHTLFAVAGLAIAVTMSARANPIEETCPSLHCSLDGDLSILQLGGHRTCGQFGLGLLDQAFVATDAEEGCVRLPVTVFDMDAIWSGGLIDFRFRIVGLDGLLGSGDNPSLVRVTDGLSEYSVRLSNDPEHGIGGLIGSAGINCRTASASHAAVQVEDVFPDGSIADWHRATLFWREAGFPSHDGRKVLLYLDDQLASAVWQEASAVFQPLEANTEIVLLESDASASTCWIDDLRVYKFMEHYTITPDELLEQTTWPGYICFSLGSGEAREPVSAFRLAPAWPNPFNPATVFEYELPETQAVVLRVYDLQGGLRATLVDGFRERGVHRTSFDGTGLASGIYVCRLEAGSASRSQAVTLVR